MKNKRIKLPVMKHFDPAKTDKKYLFGGYVQTPGQKVRVELRGGSYIEIEPTRRGVIIRALGNAAEDAVIAPDCGNVFKVQLIKAV